MGNVVFLAHDICVNTGFCKRCGAYYDQIVAGGLTCFDGVRAISHIRAQIVNKDRDPLAEPILPPGAKPFRWLDFPSFVHAHLADYAAREAAKTPVQPD